MSPGCLLPVRPHRTMWRWTLQCRPHCHFLPPHWVKVWTRPLLTQQVAAAPLALSSFVSFICSFSFGQISLFFLFTKMNPVCHVCSVSWKLTLIFKVTAVIYLSVCQFFLCRGESIFLFLFYVEKRSSDELYNEQSTTWLIKGFIYLLFYHWTHWNILDYMYI